MMRRAILATIAMLGLSGGAVRADSWEAMGAGSDEPPGIGEVGGAPGRTNYSGYPSVAMPTRLVAGTVTRQRPLPIIAFFRTDRLFASTVFALQWVGHEWQGVGGSTSGSGVAQGVSSFYAWPGVAASGEGRTWIVWAGSEGTRFAFQAFGREMVRGVWTWDSVEGSGTGKGFSEDTAGTVRRPAISVQGFDVPFVAYVQGPTNDEDVLVKILTGGGWEGFGGSGTANGVSNLTGRDYYPAVELYQGAPIVAWTHVTSGGGERILLRRYDGSTWVGLGNSTDPNTGIGSGRHAKLLNMDDSRFNDAETRLAVVYEDTAASDIGVREWDQGMWRSLGSPLTPWGFASAALDGLEFSGGGDYPSFDAAVDMDKGIVVVFRARVLVEGKAQFHLFVSRYDRIARQWFAVGDPANEPTGLSRLAHLEGAPGHVAPSLAVGLDNRPIVAWAFRDTNASEYLLVRRLKEPMAQFRNGTLDQALATTLGLPDSDSALTPKIDEGRDNIVDSADVRWIIRVAGLREGEDQP